MPIRQTQTLQGTHKTLKNTSFESIVISWLMQDGWQVFTPMLDHGHRTDILISDGPNYFRIQVKTVEASGEDHKVDNRWKDSNVVNPSVTIFIFGMLGTLIGYYIGDYISNNFLRILIFITPLYILLLVVNSKNTINKISVYVGGLLAIIFYPFFGTWSILVSGILGGSLAMLSVFKK